MNLTEFLSICPEYGKPYQFNIKTPTDENPVSKRLYFGGFCFMSNMGRPDKEAKLIPILMLPAEDGTMSNKVHGGLPTRLEWIVSIENHEMRNGVTDFHMATEPGEAESLSNAVNNLNLIAYNNTLRLMREMNVLFPGKAVRLDPETPVGAVNYYKHGCCPCNIITVAMDDKNTDLVYEVSDYEGGNEQRDDDDLGFDNRGYLLEALMRCIEEPVFGEYDDEETFIADGTKAEDIPDPDPEKTPFLYRSKIIERLKENLKNASGQPEGSPEDSCGHAECL